MSTDPHAMLEEIRHHHRQHVSVNFPAPGICVSCCVDSQPAWPCGAYRAASAALAAWNLAAEWENAPRPDDGGDRAGIAAEQVILDGIALREDITAALAGKEAGHA